MPEADDLIRILDLQPHPEGGWFRETWRAGPPAAGGDGRSAGTAIYFLLRAGERSTWHRLDAAEVWHHYAGGPLALTVVGDGGLPHRHLLGPDLTAGERPQAIVPAGAWQAAEPLGGWTLAGCTVAPGFEFAGFELAPAGWEPAAPS